MTFLSLSPDAFYEAPAASMAPERAHRAPALAHLAAMVIFAAAVTVPGAVAQAKWTKLNLIFTIVEQRCLATVSA